MGWSKESRQSRGYGADWDRVRKVVVARDLGLCQECKRRGRVAIGREVDHITPKAKAASLKWTKAKTDHPDNLELLCKPCHDAKTARDNGQAYRPKVVIGLDGWPVE